jgi:hypothetical protein
LVFGSWAGWPLKLKGFVNELVLNREWIKQCSSTRIVLFLGFKHISHYIVLNCLVNDMHNNATATCDDWTATTGQGGSKSRAGLSWPQGGGGGGGGMKKTGCR